MQYDLALFERLNERYRDTPLEPKPPKRTRPDFQARAQDKLKKLSQHLDLSGKVVMELGTGHGWLAASIVQDAGAAAAIGVDLTESADWEELRRSNPNLTLLAGDLSEERLIKPRSVDAVVSTAVLEHVKRPVQMLRAIHQILRNGGDAWLRFNLYRGRSASHRYRQVFFPWPHLLFDDEVCRAFYRKHHDRQLGFEWVNRLTAGDYVQICTEVGFEVIDVKRAAVPVENDIEFYVEFEEKLGRYPALDLETNFLTLLLKKAKRPSRGVPAIGYAGSQRALDEALASFKATGNDSSLQRVPASPTG